METFQLEGFERIYELATFKKEFERTVNERRIIYPPFPRYQKWLISCLTILDVEGEAAIQSGKFEQLIMDSKPKIYSMRYPHSKKNVRVLYGFKDNKIILLLAFAEKSGSDYKKNIDTAQRRLNKL